MSLEELKKELIKIINSIDDRNLLEGYHQMMLIDTEQVSWDDLTPEEQNEILGNSKQPSDEELDII